MDAVLLNIRSQPEGNTVAIEAALKKEMARLEQDLPADLRLAFFYDQSLFVREGVRSVWESIIFGLLLSAFVLYLFLRSARTTIVAIVAIPVTILVTLAAMYALRMSFNLMTLGGIAAAIGLVIDDAIVVVEAIYAKVCAGHPPAEAVRQALHEVGPPLVGSTLTPVVVFLPLSYLSGVPGVFFRALAMTMVCSLLVSLLLAVTLTPALAAIMLRARKGLVQDELDQGGRLLRRVIRFYEIVVRQALRHAALAVVCMGLVVAGAVFLYFRLESDFLPAQDEGAFVLDYISRPGTSLSETDRMLRHVEQILQDTPEVESYSRRTGARLALAIAEPNTGDFLVKLRPDRDRSTDEVIDGLREKVQAAEPALETEFPGVLSDLIGDLTWSPEPIEIKLFSANDQELKELAPRVAAAIEEVPGVVDVNDGVIVAGPSLRFRVHTLEAARAGVTAGQLGADLQTALEGAVASHLLDGDRVINVRVVTDKGLKASEQEITSLPLISDTGVAVTLGDIARPEHVAGLLERQREDQRQLIAVSGRLAGTDLRTGIAAIKAKLAKDVPMPPGVTVEFGGLFQQQQESFRNLTRVLLVAILLVFGVLVAEFRAMLQPAAIMVGAVLALFGVVAALWITDTSLNIVSFLSAIIGVGIVAKNGILMLDFVDHLRERGLSLQEALVQSGRRRLRPVLMTSMTTFLGLLPLAYGVGAGADMLRPLAIGVIGALCVSLALSLVATPVVYYVLVRVLLGRSQTLAVQAEGISRETTS